MRDGLHQLAVDVAGDGQVVRVGELVQGHQDGAHRAEGVEGLAPHPLPVAELEVARRDVVQARVAQDMVQRYLRRDAPRRPPDDHAKLGLVVDLRGQRRIPADLVARPDDRRTATWRRSAAPAAARPRPRRRGRRSCGRWPRPCPAGARAPRDGTRPAAGPARPGGRDRRRPRRAASRSVVSAASPPARSSAIVAGPPATRSAAGTARPPKTTPRRGPAGAWNEIRRTTPFSTPRRRRACERSVHVCYCQ